MALLILNIISFFIWTYLFIESIFDYDKSEYRIMFSIASGYIALIIFIRIIEKIVKLQ